MGFDPDYSLIRSWHEVTLPLELPFVAKFAANGKQLCFVASRHEGGVESPTLKTVRHAFDTFRPQVVVVEGVPNKGEASPRWYLDICREQAKHDYAEGGEGSYATVLAAERGIDFIPGEPSNEKMYEAFARQGYTMQDLLGWETSAFLQSRIQGGIITEDDIAGHVDSFAGIMLRETGVTGAAFGYKDYCAWYRGRMGQEFSIGHLAAADTSPSTDPGSNFLQNLMVAGDKVREPHIVKMIAEQLDRHDRVLAVYGCAHLGKQEPALANMLGPAVHSKPF